MIREAIEQLVQQGSISGDMARQVAFEILEGEASPAQIGAFVTALRIRGESVEHIRSFAGNHAQQGRAPDAACRDCARHLRHRRGWTRHI